MKKTLVLIVALAIPLLAREPLAQRIGHTDPSKYTRSRSHASAGDMACEELLAADALTSNLGFIDRCQIMPGGGVGHIFGSPAMAVRDFSPQSRKPTKQVCAA
jgi:hypothetical protein